MSGAGRSDLQEQATAATEIEEPARPAAPSHPPSSSRTRLAPRPLDSAESLEFDALDFGTEDLDPVSRSFDFGDELDKELEDTFDALLSDAGGPGAPAPDHGLESGAQLAELRTLFGQIAAEHARPIVELMGNLASARPDSVVEARSAAQILVRSSRGMGSEMLAHAFSTFLAQLDAFDVAVGPARRQAEQALRDQYASLSIQLPEAFGRESLERACETVVVRSLLCQVAGARAVTIDRIFQAGLGSLGALMRARVDDMMAAAGIEEGLAESIVERVEAYRQDRALSHERPQFEVERLNHWLRELRVLHRAYEDSTGTWSDAARADRRSLRRLRSDAYLELVISLAHLGELELIDALATLPYERKISRLDAHLRAAQ